MKLKAFSLLSGIFTKLGIYAHPQAVDSCHHPENFVLVLKYVQWKAQTSKIGRVLVDKFEVKITDNQELTFQYKQDDLIEFKINANEIIILIPEKTTHGKIKHQNRAELTFCELLKRAKIWGVQYLKE